MKYIVDLEFQMDGILIRYLPEGTSLEEILGFIKYVLEANNLIQTKKVDYPGPEEDCRRMWTSNRQDMRLLLGMLGEYPDISIPMIIRQERKLAETARREEKYNEMNRNMDRRIQQNHLDRALEQNRVETVRREEEYNEMNRNMDRRIQQNQFEQELEQNRVKSILDKF